MRSVRSGSPRREFLAAAAAAGAAAAFGMGRSAAAGEGGSEPNLPIPTLDRARIVRRTAGLRPYRDGGIRLEAEAIGEKTVVHCYGHGGAGVTLSWGSAERAADLVAALPGAARSPVAVLGSGAVGLAVARVLLERGHAVRVLARDFPPGTTSNLSGAMWLPVSVDPGSDRALFRKLGADSWRRFAALAALPGSGVVKRPLYETGGVPAAEADLPAEMVATKSAVARLPFAGIEESGRRWETFLIEPPLYLPFLLRDVLRAGAIVAEKTFASPADLAALPESTIVNCLGLGAGEVFSDPAVIPVRGQLVYLFPEALPYLLTHGGGYLFPRGDAIVLGGTFERGVADETPDPAACERIFASHRRFFG